MKFFLIIFLSLCMLHLTSSHITIQQLDFLNIRRYLRYGRNLIIGDPKFNTVFHMPFEPYQPYEMAKRYQRLYGYRGENLIHALGAGYSISELKKFGAV